MTAGSCKSGCQLRADQLQPSSPSFGRFSETSVTRTRCSLQSTSYLGKLSKPWLNEGAREVTCSGQWYKKLDKKGGEIKLTGLGESKVFAQK